MSGIEFRQRLAAILAADAAGYSRLMAADERATVLALDSARAVFRDHIESRHGRVIDMAGDSVLAVFETAAGAVEAALAIQLQLNASARALPEDRRMRFRIGLHLGDVTEKADGSVYGDGVNIAARLQQLAAPGGITVSQAIHAAVKNRVAAAFEDLGEQPVKNIPEPVRAFAVDFGESASRVSALRRLRWPRWMPWVAAVAAAIVFAGALWWSAPSSPGASRPPVSTTALTLPSKPSIAVLPFENMGGDPEQTYFADGMTEDLITDLSKIGELFVISRNSTFAYKGKPRDVREIARTLGVRYVLEGSVRRAGDEIRINVQLIDATTGGHVWADRYDGQWKNVFALQDEVASKVVGAMAVELTKEDRERVTQRGTQNAQAYDEFLKGWQRYQRQTPEDFRNAIAHFKQAAELDPKYGRAYAALAAIHWEAYKRYWSQTIGVRRPHLRAEEFLAQAMRYPTPLAHQVASAMLTHRKQHAEAVAEAGRAVAGDPNDAEGYVALADALSFAGKPGDALEMMERALRLNPHHPNYYLYQQGLAQFTSRRLDQAVATLEKALAKQPDDHWSQRLLLATYGQLGRQPDAKKLLEALQTNERRGTGAFQDPLTVKAIGFWYPFARSADAEHFAEGLRRAGLPD